MLVGTFKFKCYGTPWTVSFVQYILQYQYKNWFHFGHIFVPRYCSIKGLYVRIFIWGMEVNVCRCGELTSEVPAYYPHQAYMQVEAAKFSWGQMRKPAPRKCRIVGTARALQPERGAPLCCTCRLRFLRLPSNLHACDARSRKVHVTDEASLALKVSPSSDPGHTAW